ncbi:MAG: SCO family protein, partial [Actinomycetes bacterium]
MPGTVNTSLARALYTMLAWQALVLCAVTVLVFLGWRAVRYGRAQRPDDGWNEYPVEPRGRKVLRIGIGVLWLVDGLLQAQPAMPSGFFQQMLAPDLADAPGWLVSLVDPVARVWLQHPVAADAATVWLQIGLGIGILVGGRGFLSRAVLLSSVAWAGFVWVFGELMGGLTDPAASWLTGAPGAALLYIVGAALLLAPWSSWDLGLAAAWARRSVGLTFLLGAALQSLPRSGYWTPTGLSTLFADVANGGLPGAPAAPVRWLAQVLPSNAGLANAVVVAGVAALGLGLLVGRFGRLFTILAAAACFLAWWFGQGFGVFGGLGTDPNTAAVLLVLLGAGWPGWACVPTTEGASSEGSRQPRPTPVSALWGAVAVAAVVVLPFVALLDVARAPSATAAIGDSGGAVELSPTPAPDIVLTDQHGDPLALHDFRGDLVFIAFLDPVCLDNCPLMANQLSTAVRLLGPAGRSIQILAVDVNPTFNAVRDVRTFTDEHGLGSLPNWHFVTGSNDQFEAVLADYRQSVS